MSVKRPKRVAFLDAKNKLKNITQTTAAVENNNEKENNDDVDDGKMIEDSKIRRTMRPQLHHRTKTFTRNNEAKGKTMCNLSKWQDFTKHNYKENDLLYGLAKPIFKAVAETEFEQLMQTTWPKSIKYMYKYSNKEEVTTASECQQLQRFNSTTILANESLIFTGAPVEHLAWIPLPNKVKEQYILLTMRNPNVDYTRLKAPTRQAATLLLYKMSAESLNEEQLLIELHYAITVPEGPVNCIELLPSGGYSDKINRLALLAIGTPSCYIDVYELPIKVDKARPHSFQCIELQPIWRLSLMRSTTTSTSMPAHLHTLTDTQCLHLSWSHFQQHQHIFSVHSNGCISIWQIPQDAAEHQLQQHTLADLTDITPINYFYVGERILTNLAIHYDANGPRWLALSCVSRQLLVYDIRDLSKPMPIRKASYKNIVTCIHWPHTWHNFLVSFSDVTSSNDCCINAVNIIPTTVTHSKLVVEPYGIIQVDYNPWFNVLVYSTDDGLVKLLEQPENAFSLKPQRKRSRAKLLTTQVLEYALTARQHNESEATAANILELYNNNNYEKYLQTYNLVFQTNEVLTDYNNKTASKRQLTAPLLLMHFRRINCLKNNLNFHGKQLLAIGYEMGFLRVIRLKNQQR